MQQEGVIIDGGHYGVRSKEAGGEMLKWSYGGIQGIKKSGVEAVSDHHEKKSLEAGQLQGSQVLHEAGSKEWSGKGSGEVLNH